MTKAILPRWTTLPVGFRTSNAALELRARYGGDGPLALEQLFEEADQNGVFEPGVFGIAHRAGGIDPDIIKETIKFAEKKELLILFVAEGRELAINIKHHLYHPRGQSSCPFTAKVPHEIRKQVERICPEAANRWWPEGLALLKSPKRSNPNGDPKGRDSDKNETLRGAKTEKMRPLGARKQEKGAPKGFPPSTPLETRLDKTRLEEKKNSFVGASAPQAASAPKQLAPITQEIVENAKGQSQILKDVLLLFEPRDHWVIIGFICRCLTGPQLRTFEAKGALPESQQMQDILRELMLIRHGEARRDGMPLPRRSYSRLLEIIYGATVKTNERFTSNTYLKIAIERDWGMPLPEADPCVVYEDKEEETDDEASRRTQKEDLGSRLAELCENKRIPKDVLHVWAQEHYDVTYHIELEAEAMQKLVDHIEKEPPWTRETIISWLGQDELRKPVEQFRLREDVLELLELPQPILRVLRGCKHTRLKLNLSRLPLHVALTLTPREVEFLRHRTVAPGAFEAMRGKLQGEKADG